MINELCPGVLKFHSQQQECIHFEEFWLKARLISMGSLMLIGLGVLTQEGPPPCIVCFLVQIISFGVLRSNLLSVLKVSIVLWLLHA